MTIEAYQSVRSSVDVATLRPVDADDRERLAGIVEAAGNFNREEIATAIELIDEAIANDNRGDYVIFVLEDRSFAQGFVCVGPTPLAKGVYDLYWIAVDPGTRAKGYGRRLLRFAEEEVRRRGARMIVIETSSLPSYQASRRLYSQAGYQEVARVANFYNVGDDKLIFSKPI